MVRCLLLVVIVVSVVVGSISWGSFLGVYGYVGVEVVPVVMIRKKNLLWCWVVMRRFEVFP